MKNISLQTGKFSEELYFLLMASPVRQRIISLAGKYGLTNQELREEIIRYANEITYKITEPGQTQRFTCSA
ncbi:MAG: hypothetical protein JW860_08825 [Sedimentisphaerales bacterium]|nr:hypothetical protein [Sedimentisphaerales bacterium]